MAELQTQSIVRHETIALSLTANATERAGDREDEVDTSVPDIIHKAFRSGESGWMEEPVIQQWANAPLEILNEANQLYHAWRRQPPGPFCPYSDPLWMQTTAVLPEVGLPWHNNNVNSPEEVDPTWPFQFKLYEKRAVVAKGRRVGDADAFGYVTSWDEANHYGIRSLQHELRHQTPDHRPLLVGCRIEQEILQSAAQLFGLEILRISDGDWDAAATQTKRHTTNGQRPVIFAATMANSHGQADNFPAIRRFLSACPGLLHVDASRTFDYITSLPVAARKRCGIPRLVLRHMRVASAGEDDPYTNTTTTTTTTTVYASTIVAAGMNCRRRPPCLVLRPRTLGCAPAPMVEYVRGADDTLAGSRDSLGPLIVYLQELRFGVDGCRQIYDQCRRWRQIITETLVKHRVRVDVPSTSLDLVLSPEKVIPPAVQRRMGLVVVEGFPAKYLLTVQPSVTAGDMKSLVRATCGDNAFPDDLLSFFPSSKHEYPIPKDMVYGLQLTVSQWRAAAPSSGGFPLNQATYSALGPALGHFLSVSIPPKWASHQMHRMLTHQKRRFGVPEAQLDEFVGGFTNGGTMGNRVGLHTALQLYPSAYVYYSSASHYSVKKILRDNDAINGRWDEDHRPRYAEIEADALGRIKPDALVERVRLDRDYCRRPRDGKEHRIILVANIGTTFAGGRDDILAVRRKLRSIGADTSYILADGALDLGFSSEIVQLGPAGRLMGNAGAPVVQAVTLSHHKVFGVMVSGEVICHIPGSTGKPTLAAVAAPGDPRAVLEMWVIRQMYSAEDLARTQQYCLENAGLLRRLLRRLLRDAGMEIRFNAESPITMLEREVPPWLMHEFHLAPEGDWVHFITMPHVSPWAVRRFVESITCLDALFAAVFEYVRPRLEAALGVGDFNLVRVRCRDQRLLSRIVAMGKGVDQGDSECHHSVEEIKRRYIYGSMSFAAINASSQRPLAVFLANTSSSREVWPGPVIMGGDEPLCDMRSLRGIAQDAFGMMSKVVGFVKS
ncbi:hypothetical protein FE257_008979 [Aspergillus nanangensis]|uniref:Pyridoxal phosphate-dependent transferase n=1 Tax=Aspergillus nanangensis TaxID=2582783 RepID=A0AAD4CX01_ASPNN|nr:hypothetical protein FE257_008979 [Aspergillus nanangensis]